jgi:hypothetical protein
VLLFEFGLRRWLLHGASSHVNGIKKPNYILTSIYLPYISKPHSPTAIEWSRKWGYTSKNGSAETTLVRTLQAMNEQTREYRAYLVNTEQKSQENFDKTVLSLSGGALGISFAFVKDIVGTNPLSHQGYLLFSWIVWGISVTCVLASFYFSNQAIRKAINQVDNGNIYKQTPGGSLSKITALLNMTGGLLFLTGVILMVIFVYYNLR